MELVEFYLEPSKSSAAGEITLIESEFGCRRSVDPSSHPFSFKCELASIPNVGELISCGQRKLAVVRRSRQFRNKEVVWVITLNLLGEGNDRSDDTDFLYELSAAWDLSMDLTIDKETGRAGFTRSIFIE